MVFPLNADDVSNAYPLFDAGAVRRAIFDRTLSALQGASVENQRHVLQLNELAYAPDDPEEYSPEEEKRALLEGLSLTRRLQGRWNLIDKTTGKVIDSRKQLIARVPYLTNRGTFIRNGSDLVILSQQRLRPGVFTRVKENGEIEAHVNILPTKGTAHRYQLDPATGLFYVNVGQARIPLLPLLKAVGADDKQIQQAWGPKLFEANAQAKTFGAINKLVQRFVRQRGQQVTDEAGQRELLRKTLTQMEVDPVVTAKTLGKPYKNVTADMILDATRRILAVSRGEAAPDNRDDLVFQTYHGPEDQIAERLEQDFSGLRRKLLGKLSFSSSLKKMPPAALQAQIDAAFTKSGLGQNLEEVNPIDLLDKRFRISRLGVGGIPSLEVVPDEARDVQDSHFGFIDPLRTPESLRAGVDLQFTRHVRKGPSGQIYVPFIDAKTGKTVFRSPAEVAEAVVAFPGEMESPRKRVYAMVGGRLQPVLKEKVTLIIPAGDDEFSPVANLVPLKMASKGQRIMMGSRMLTQALPLKNAEAPLLQNMVPGEVGVSFEDKYGEQVGALRWKEDQPARVVSVSPTEIVVKKKDGTTQSLPLYNELPFNRKTSLHQTPVVKPGDNVTAGDLLARSNYTDDRGTVALGVNARTAYLPYRGLAFKDAAVISESFAKRLTSEHMYQHSLYMSEDHKLGTNTFVSLFPGKYDKRQLSQLDENGLAKPGTVLQKGDPIFVAAEARPEAYNRIHKKGSKSWVDASQTWEYEVPGVVTAAVVGKAGPTVAVKGYFPAQVGDKIAGRYGDKTVISEVVPDEKMPQDQEGRPFELIVSPMGIVSRVNPSQVYEALLSEAAKRRGEPYKLEDFARAGNLRDFVYAEARKYGVPLREVVYDPEEDRKIVGDDGKGVLTGTRFIMKLHHTSEGKAQSRSIGGYTATGEPSRGGETGSKRLALMDTNALIAHGVPAVLRDASLIRGQRNVDEFWLQFMQGHTPREPSIPLVYAKFINELKAAGINVVPDGHQLHLKALTNKDIDLLAGDREIKTGDAVHWDKNMRPVHGGLFDPTLTGGHNGNRWAYIRLPEPTPSPVFEEPIRRLLGLTEQEFRDVLAGKERLKDGGSGPLAIKKVLESLNLDKEIELARAQIREGRASQRDSAIRRLMYLKSAKQVGIHPKEWLWDKVPVLPPVFRPVSLMSSKTPLVADANYLYKELITARDNFEKMRGAVADVGDERLALYDSLKAVVGLGDPLQAQLQQKRVRGLLASIFGDSPKFGDVQRRLLSSSVDLVGRSVIVPDPDLDMDSVGLPEPQAWELYKLFVVRQLRRRGLPVLEAVRHVKEQTPLAKEELLRAVAERPVYIDRAPVLHKYGILAFWPKLTKGHVLRVSPQVLKGFNADFDGDAMNYHVPVSEEAVEQAKERMLPSKNLISPANFKTPASGFEEDYVGGLYEATKEPKKGKAAKYFHTQKDAIQAAMRGEIAFDDPVVIVNKT